MIARELIDTAQVPGGNEELRLFRRGADFMIVLDRNELMNSRMSGSEEALAEMTLARLEGDAPRVLIGGYGMGFTLRAALARTGADAVLVVVELVPKILEWARGPMAELAAGCLDDQRERLMDGDVAASIGAAREEYDAILLDVDNGPDGLTRLGNDRLYTMTGLGTAMRALKPGGVLAIWSAGPDQRFSRRMRDAGFDVEEVAVRARSNGKGPRHVIWFGRKP
ncbi:MAG: spermidine synthase [Sphingomonadales bacterium]|nr:MAG: spermidine synthase [Sphingomonadales bacterium]